MFTMDETALESNEIEVKWKSNGCFVRTTSTPRFDSFLVVTHRPSVVPLFVLACTRIHTVSPAYVAGTHV